MNNFTFESWASYKTKTQPDEGFNVSTDYSTPESETEKRNQLESLHSQTKDFINTTMVAGINAIDNRVTTAEGKITSLQTHEIENITADETMTIRKVGKNVQLSVNVSATGEVTKAYVDGQDTILDNKITANTNAIGVNAGNIVTTNSNVTALGNRVTAIERVITGTLTTGQNSITISDAAIASNSVLSFYTSIFGVFPKNAVVSNGSVTLTFNAQSADMIVGVKVEGTYGSI